MSNLNLIYGHLSAPVDGAGKVFSVDKPVNTIQCTVILPFALLSLGMSAVPEKNQKNF